MRQSSIVTLSMLKALAAVPLLVLLGGCGGLGTSPAKSTTPIAAIHGLYGTVYGGQQPVAGAAIQLYTMNQTTLRGAATPQLAPGSVLTSSNGGFNITTTYTCPTGDYVYIVATGGNAGAGVNSNIAMMAGVGVCGSISSARLSINELTTVATVYALAPFMKDLSDAGYAGPSTTGIANAFAMMNSLVNIATGTLPGATAPANATMPTIQINSLADLIAGCINGVTTSTQCSSLFGAVSNSGAAPTNTVDALLDIAHNPGAQVGPIFSGVSGEGPYQPTWTSAPNDYTVTVKLTGGPLATPYGVAIDGSGNAWVTNETGASVAEFSPVGSTLTGSGSVYAFSGAQGLTIDPSGDIWIANTGGNTILKLNSTGGLVTTVSSPSLNAPVDIAADARGNIWVANFLPLSSGYTLSEFNNSGVFQNGLTGNINAPAALAVDPQGNVWVSNSGSGDLAEYSKTFTQVSTGAGYTDNALQGPAGIAFDASGNAWVAGQGGPELSGFGSTGTTLATTPVWSGSGTTLAQPTGVAVDGSGTIWVSNSVTSGYLSEFAPGTGAPVSMEQTLGYPLNSPVQLAIDPSGNLWTADSGDSSVTIFVGLATPTLTPLVARTQ